MFFISFKKAGLIKAKSSIIKNANSASPTKYHISVRIAPFNGLYDRFGSPYRGQTPQKEGGNRPTQYYLFENLPVLPYR